MHRKQNQGLKLDMSIAPGRSHQLGRHVLQGSVTCLNTMSSSSKSRIANGTSGQSLHKFQSVTADDCIRSCRRSAGLATWMLVRGRSTMESELGEDAWGDRGPAD